MLHMIDRGEENSKIIAEACHAQDSQTAPTDDSRSGRCDIARSPHFGL